MHGTGTVVVLPPSPPIDVAGDDGGGTRTAGDDGGGTRTKMPPS